MRIRIDYRADYRYEAEVSFSPHLFRLFPRIDLFVTVLRSEFKTNAGANVQYRRDLFDNEIARCFYPEKSSLLESSLVLEFELKPKNPFHFLLDSRAIDFPFEYTPHERRVLSASLLPQFGDFEGLPFWKTRPGPTVETLVEINESIYKNIGYERREEGEARTPRETLQAGAGACRDFAVLLAETLRANGVAARLVSGYLCEFGKQEKRAEGSLHAWVEAYLPGAGWIGIDPTNGTFANHYHIATAVGLVSDDISPMAGSYYNETPVASKMHATLELTNCDI